MQLTNYGFLESRGNYLAAQAKYTQPMERLSTGLKINHSRDDAGALGKAALQRVASTKLGVLRTNLQNALSYANVQDNALEKVGQVYDRMATLAHQAADFTIDDHSRSGFDGEFQMLEGQLAEILKEKFNGISLFTKATGCTEPEVIELSADFSAGLNEGDPPVIVGPPKEWISSKDVGTTDGKLTLRVNSGIAAERYVVMQGTDVIFDTGQWKTQGNAYQHDFDEFVIEFGAGKPTTYTYQELDTGGQFGVADPTQPARGSNPTGTPGAPAPDGFFANTAAGYGEGGSNQTGVIQTFPSTGLSTNLTIKVESTTLFQAEAAFEGVLIIEPEVVPALEVVINEKGEIASFEALGFSRLSGADLSTRENAQAVLERLLGKNGEATEHGEIHCLVNGQRGELGKSMRRMELEIERLENKTISGEKTLGRIEDADMAQEATKFAKQSMKMEMAANIMSRATRLTDVLLQLATQRVGGSNL